MSMITGTKSVDIRPIKSDGTSPTTKEDQAGLSAGVTLTSSTTYLYEVDPTFRRAGLVHFHIKWDNAAILTITLEDSDLPEVHGYSTTAGEWVEQDSTLELLAINKTSGTLTGTSLAVPGGTAGGATFACAHRSAMRTRLKVVVGGTGGVVRVAAVGRDD